jgi:Raf kinase inhibitor-like YbhB/YbcL family protein
MAKARRWDVWLLLLLLAVLVSGIGLVVRRDESRKDIVDAGTVPALTVTSSSFSDGAPIPAKFTCDGGDTSPQLSFSPAPAGTKSLALIVDDPDAPGGSFVHWVVFNLPPGLHDLPEGASALQNGVQGSNDFEKSGYGGPCPPGGNLHHYSFRVYALDTMLALSQGATKKQVTRAARNHVLAEGKLTGLYRRGQ